MLSGSQSNSSIVALMVASAPTQRDAMEQVVRLALQGFQYLLPVRVFGKAGWSKSRFGRQNLGFGCPNPGFEYPNL